MMNKLDVFIAALKEHLGSAGKSFVCDGDNPWANGNTEAGFSADKVIDLDALNAEIDAFADLFKKSRNTR